MTIKQWQIYIPPTSTTSGSNTETSVSTNINSQSTSGGTPIWQMAISVVSGMSGFIGIIVGIMKLRKHCKSN